MYPKTLVNLIEAFKLLPGVGQKTAERYALVMLDQDQIHVDGFANALTQAKENIKECPVCHNLTDFDTCSICTDPQRDQSIICVVSNVKEVFSIEKMNQYNGLYHVLGGVISTQKGILPDQ
ncbi:MAG: recombination protein RecR, partial [Erysipelothrix sp.]|nr:recombination protein RecR [Erysipelothrix sp.]